MNRPSFRRFRLKHRLIVLVAGLALLATVGFTLAMLSEIVSTHEERQ